MGGKLDIVVFPLGIYVLVLIYIYIYINLTRSEKIYIEKKGSCWLMTATPPLWTAHVV